MVEGNKIRGSKEAQYARREAGVRMLLSGRYSHTEIAEVLGVSPGTVRNWSSRLRLGSKVLQHKKQRGRPAGVGRALTRKQEAAIRTIIRNKNPKDLNIGFYLWSIGAVMTLIEQKYGVTLSASGIRKYLASWKFTVQRPATRYSLRDDVVIQHWLMEEYPLIVIQADKEGAEIHWLDETGVNNQEVYQRGYAPRGKTPTVRKATTKIKISLISTVTNRGKMRFHLYEGALTGELLIHFLENLLRDAEKKLFVIMDNLQAHKSQKVRDWQEKHQKEITLFYLPPYAPDINPDEYLNDDLKQNVHRKTGLPLSKKELKSNVLRYMRHIQKSSEKVRGYFKAPETLYAA